jgi:hypothetical protein
MERLIAKNPRNKERIFPYIGGEEVNTNPIHAHHRYVIDFGDMSEEDARQWPDLMDILERKVRTVRLKDNRENYRRYWWQFAERRPGLAIALKSQPRILARSLTSKHFAFAFLPSGMVYDQTLVVFALPAFRHWALLSSRIHEVWSNFFGATLEDRPRYNVAACFETFPVPSDSGADILLEKIGRTYYEYRARVMEHQGEGLTATYNCFHDAECECSEIAPLREFHEAMDRVVLDAYGWTDIPTRCQFIPEFDDEEGDDENGRTRRKKYRYRWPDDIRDEVLARLLELNRRRALEEGQLPTETPVFAGMSDPEAKTKGGKKKAGKRASEDFNLSLLPQEKEEA